MPVSLGGCCCFAQIKTPGVSQCVYMKGPGAPLVFSMQWCSLAMCTRASAAGMFTFFCTAVQEEKTQGDGLHLDHAWNAHLTAANRNSNQGILKMFKSDWDAASDEENEKDSPHTSSCCHTPRQLQPDAAPQSGCVASPRDAGCGPPARILCAPHAGDTAALRLCADPALGLQETAFGPATVEMGPSTPAQLPHSISQESNIPGSMATMPAASISYPSTESQLTNPAVFLAPACIPASTPTTATATTAAVAALPSSGLGPVTTRSTRTTAELTSIAAQPAQGGYCSVFLQHQHHAHACPLPAAHL